MEDKLRTAANQAARSKRVEESLTDEQVKEEVAEILYEISGGDFDFDIEGGCFPVKDFCSEYAAQIHSLYTARIEQAKTEEREEMSEWIDARFSDNITKGVMLSTSSWQVYMDEGK